MSAKMTNIVKKQYLITGYLEFLLEKLLSRDENQNSLLEIITPRNPNQRGAQLSVIFSVSLEKVQKHLDERGIVVGRTEKLLLEPAYLAALLLQCDIRMPNVMRITPCALYTRYVDVFNFVTTLKSILRSSA